MLSSIRRRQPSERTKSGSSPGISQTVPVTVQVKGSLKPASESPGRQRRDHVGDDYVW
jgi:hypothetical protein